MFHNIEHRLFFWIIAIIVINIIDGNIIDDPCLSSYAQHCAAQKSSNSWSKMLDWHMRFQGQVLHTLSWVPLLSLSFLSSSCSSPTPHHTHTHTRTCMDTFLHGVKNSSSNIKRMSGESLLCCDERQRSTETSKWARRWKWLSKVMRCNWGKMKKR